jgi:hypothetical protein
VAKLPAQHPADRRSRDLGFINGSGFCVSADFASLRCIVRQPFLGDLCVFGGRVVFGWQNFQHSIQQIVDPAAVFRGNREHPLDPQTMEFVNDACLLFGVSFVDREKERTPGLPQQADQFKVRTGERGTAIHDHNDGGRFVERNPSLAKNLRWDEIFFFGKNAAGVDDADAASTPLGVTI